MALEQATQSKKLLEEGRLLARTGKFEEAEKKFRELLTYFPDKDWVFYAICSCLISMEKLQEAEKTALEGLGYNSKSTMLRESLAKIYCLTNQFDKAQKVIEEAIKLEPSNAYSHHILSDILDQGKKNPEKSYFHLHEALRLEPNSPTIMSRLAFKKTKDGHFKEAEEIFLQALKIKPDDAVLHQNYGFLLQKTKRLKEAQEQLLIARRLDPQSESIETDLRAVLLAKKPILDWSLKIFGRIVQIILHFPVFPIILVNKNWRASPFALLFMPLFILACLSCGILIYAFAPESLKIWGLAITIIYLIHVIFVALVFIFKNQIENLISIENLSK